MEKDLLNKAVVAFKAGQYGTAVRIFTKALSADSGNFKLRDGRAQANMKLKAYNEALLDAEQMVKIDPTNAKGYLHAARIFQALGKPDSGVKICRIARKKVPGTDTRLKEIERLERELVHVTKGPGNTNGNDDVPAGRILRPATPQSNEGIPSHVSSQKPSDPLRLPLELIESIHSYLPFATICLLLRVSPAWRTTLLSNKRHWLDIDLCGTEYKIKNQTVSTLVNRGRGAIKSLVLKDCCDLTNPSLKALLSPFRCKDLTRLEITGNAKISSTAIQGVIAPYITRLVLSRTKTDNQTVRRALDICRLLGYLDVSDCPHIDDDAFSICENFAKTDTPLALETLSVERVNITDRTVYLLSLSSPSLASINLGGTNITDRSLVNLANCCSLSDVVLPQSLPPAPGLSITDAVTTFASAVHLTLCKLNFTRCPRLDDSTVGVLGMFCANLEEVQFGTSANIGDEALISMSRDCLKLRIIGLGTCPRISDRGVIALVEELREMESLDVSNNQNITDAVLDAIVRKGSALVAMNFNNCTRLTGAAVGRLIKKVGRATEVLRLSNCVRVHQDTISKLREALPRALISCRFT
ncbi:hypothetical protein HK104_004008 [Borealophlyctis nickersoniae]|nr:hypothetical protein HK104_004008 [Borealophlyctis nickersoniae]